MRVVPDTGNGDIHFNVFVAEVMHETCRIERNVQMAALIAALAQLPRLDRPDSEADDESVQYASLQKVHDLLREQGVSTWLDGDFDPAEAATAIESFEVRNVPEEDD